MDQSQKIIERLRMSGSRITALRRQLVQTFVSADTPLSAPELLALLRPEYRSVNKTTVYRELSFLVQEGVVRQIDLLEGLKRYELIRDGGHHHHIVCTCCQAIACIEMENDLALLERHIEDSYGFKIVSHTLEFFGLCQNCQRSGASPQSGE